MRVLIIKTTSMGDVIHTLPALTDAGKKFPDIRFDWVVEKSFAEIPGLHPLVDTVIPVQIRKWRKNWFKTLKSMEWKTFRKNIQAKQYDYIIDAQGLIKSALITRMARGLRCGLNWKSAWEPLASLFYKKKISIDPDKHAIYRVRKLFANVFDYTFDEERVEYGIDRITLNLEDSNYITFLHSTTWVTKHWPEQYWCELAKLLTDQGLRIKLPWGNDIEKARAERIAAIHPNIQVLPKLDLVSVAKVLAGSIAVIAVDTGLGHLAAALDVPTISLYGPTHPQKIGTRGASQIHLKEAMSCDKACSRKRCAIAVEKISACFKVMTAQKVFETLQARDLLKINCYHKT